MNYKEIAVANIQRAICQLKNHSGNDKETNQLVKVRDALMKEMI